MVDRRVVAAKVPARTIGKDDSPCFLQGAVGIDQFTADGPRIGVLPKRIEQRQQPAGLRQRVVVEKDEKLSCGGFGASVTTVDETKILSVMDDPT